MRRLPKRFKTDYANIAVVVGLGRRETLPTSGEPPDTLYGSTGIDLTRDSGHGNVCPTRSTSIKGRSRRLRRQADAEELIRDTVIHESATTSASTTTPWSALGAPSRSR
jgi:hypothetical protein